ncbi:MAG: hypothetical protein JWO12_3630 [Frankiales bacterium]|nr:hypothetical protein [Frankiales bacterium]
MSERNTVAHFLHDAGLAAWFGGSLMGAVGVNGAAAEVDDPRRAAQVANTGWARWTPFNAVAIGAHLLGGAQLLRANRGRVKTQKGVLGNTNVKLALTAGALGATAYSRVLGQKVIDAGDVPVDADVNPRDPSVAKAQKQLKALQWAIPGLTGAVMASSALHEEQQRPSQVLRGSLQALPARAVGVAGTVGALASAKAVSAAHAAGPALEKTRAAAVPAVEKARERAASAYEIAVDKAKDALPA